MSEPDITLPVLIRTREILRERGWQVRYSAADGGPINIRSAISIACREIAKTEHEWYLGYRRAVSTLALFLKDGVTSWEFGTHASKPRFRKDTEIFELFDKVIGKLEAHDEKTRTRTAVSNSSSTAV